MPISAPQAESVAQQLLDAHVAHHLARLSGDELAPTVARLVDDVLTTVGRHRVEDLLDREATATVVVRVLVDVVRRERVEAVLDELPALEPVLEEALEQLTASPLVGTMASRFMGRIVGEVLQANKAVTDKVPGLGSLMSFGTSAASKMMGAADKQFEGLIGDTVGKGGTFAVRRLNRILLETLRDPTTRAAVLEVWDLLAQESRTGPSDHVARLGEVVVEGFFDRFGRHTLTELLDELDLGRADLVADVVRLAPQAVDVLRKHGDLDRLLRAELEPFYTSPEVTVLLSRQGLTGPA